VRLFVLFKAPVEHVLEWDEGSIKGQARFVRRIYHLYSVLLKNYASGGVATVSLKDQETLERHRLQLIANITAALDHDISFNTAIADLMKFFNVLTDMSRFDRLTMGTTENAARSVSNTEARHFEWKDADHCGFDGILATARLSAEKQHSEPIRPIAHVKCITMQ
jgi:leucyl-tRNA synthetase